ncbi:hypothetical protein EV421DRAFT_1732636 [Armillaria borealis]|uniref:Uncharacterized protein n=1 Tax=Armillaria borealis TaxID=47425 RepID=A0AA39JUV5_9AGAR|nr:hypothetical protein EV421DRAFT_1732636 [Armillaria borealis]
MAPCCAEIDKSRPCGGVLEVEGFAIEGIDIAASRRSKRTAAALLKQAAELKQPSQTKATSKSLELRINEQDHSEPRSNSTTCATRKSHKKAGPTTSTNVVPEESEGSPRHGQPHHQEDPSELAVPDAQVRIPVSQCMTTVQEDNEEINLFAPTLPSSSPHILEGPYDFVSPLSTPSHLHSALMPSCPSAGGATAYRFVHFEEPSVKPSSPAESLSLSSPSLASAPPSPASVSMSPLSSAKDQRDADNVWPFYLEEGDRQVCKLCWAGDKHKNAKEKTYSMSTGTTSLRHHLIREYLKLLNTSIKGNGTKAAEKFRKANERDLLRHGFYFCAVEKRIRCFAHIVNLAAKAVISAVTALNAVLLEESMDITRDPVAAVRALVRAVRSSIDLSEMKMDLSE